MTITHATGTCTTKATRNETAEYEKETATQTTTN